MNAASPLAAAVARRAATAGAPRSSAPRHARWIALGLGLLWCKVLLFCAWQGDDAFITHRSAANLVAGHGAVWNVGERVQAYTHPLWFAVSTFCHALVGEGFVSVLLVSMGLTGVTVAGIGLGVARDWRVGALLVGALSTSSAVVDYGVSGLENPLLYLLLVGGLLATTKLPMPREIRFAGALVAAVGLTRLDALVLAGPPLLAMVSGIRPRRLALRPLVVAAVPLALWVVVSVVYYGVPVPNTALAKLNLGIAKPALWAQGARYLRWSVVHDPTTPTLIGAGVALALWRGGRVERAAATGVLLYLAYVVSIGGDFMAGRFLAAPTVVGATLVARVWRPARDAGAAPASGRHARWVTALALCVCAVGLARPTSPWRTPVDYGNGRPPADIVGADGIADERALYQRTTGLLRNLVAWSALRDAGAPIPPYPRARLGHRHRGRSGVSLQDEVGFYGYFAGPGTYVVDAWALADPLLARVPYVPVEGWRVGHYPRRLPDGYYESLQQNRNLIRDPALRAAYADIRLVTRAPVFAEGRAGAVWRLLTGAHAAAFRAAAATRAPREAPR